MKLYRYSNLFIMFSNIPYKYDKQTSKCKMCLKCKKCQGIGRIINCYCGTFFCWCEDNIKCYHCKGMGCFPNKCLVHGL